MHLLSRPRLRAINIGHKLLDVRLKKSQIPKNVLISVS